MLILMIMAVGVLIGLTVFPAKLKKGNEKIQLICTLVLIFSMGLMLGRRDHFLAELSAIGLTSFLLAMLPIFFSVCAVYFLSRIFLVKKRKASQREPAAGSEDGAAFPPGAAESHTAAVKPKKEERRQ